MIIVDPSKRVYKLPILDMYRETNRFFSLLLLDLEVAVSVPLNLIDE